MSALFASLIQPRLCALLPSISKGQVKLRYCTTCGKQCAPPYVCPLDRQRQTFARPELDGTQDRQGGGTPHFDRLAAALFDGETKLVNFKFTPGTDPNVTSEQRAAEIYASMERAGRIVDGKLQPFGKPEAVPTHPDREGKGGER